MTILAAYNGTLSSGDLFHLVSEYNDCLYKKSIIAHEVPWVIGAITVNSAALTVFLSLPAVAATIAIISLDITVVKVMSYAIEIKCLQLSKYKQIFNLHCTSLINDILSSGWSITTDTNGKKEVYKVTSSPSEGKGPFTGPLTMKFEKNG